MSNVYVCIHIKVQNQVWVNIINVEAARWPVEYTDICNDRATSDHRSRARADSGWRMRCHTYACHHNTVSSRSLQLLSTPNIIQWALIECSTSIVLFV